MTEQWKFRFTVPDIPGGKPITASEAEATLLKQLETRERDPEEVMWNLARLYSLTGHQDIAFQCVQQLVAATVDPEKKAACYLAMGQLMEQVNDYEAAIKFYSEAMALEPVNSQTWYFIYNNLGYCLNHFGRYVEGERYCQTAIQIDALRHNAYKNLGISLEGQGLFAPAARCYVAAVQANASDPRALQHLEQLLTKHPEVTLELEDIQQQLEACRAAVQIPRQMAEQLEDRLKHESKPNKLTLMVSYRPISGYKSGIYENKLLVVAGEYGSAVEQKMTVEGFMHSDEVACYDQAVEIMAAVRQRTWDELKSARVEVGRVIVYSGLHAQQEAHAFAREVKEQTGQIPELVICDCELSYKIEFARKIGVERVLLCECSGVRTMGHLADYILGKSDIDPCTQNVCASPAEFLEKYAE